jgi:hypothetical protein
MNNSPMPDRPIPEEAATLSECRRLGRERRERISNLVLDLFTNGSIDTNELAHFKTISHFFGIEKTVQQICVDHCTAGEELIQETMLATVLCCLERAIR